MLWIIGRTSGAIIFFVEVGDGDKADFCLTKTGYWELMVGKGSTRRGGEGGWIMFLEVPRVLIITWSLNL